MSKYTKAFKLEVVKKALVGSTSSTRETGSGTHAPPRRKRCCRIACQLGYDANRVCPKILY